MLLVLLEIMTMQRFRFFCVFICVLIVGSATAKSKKYKPIEKVDTIAVATIPLQGVAVVPFGDTLFYVYGNVGSFSAKQRAASIQDKISILGENLLFDGDSIKFADFGGYLNIMYEKEILMSIDSVQAIQEGKSKLETAQLYRERMIDAIDFELHNNGWEQVILQGLSVVGIIIAEFFLIKLLIYGYRRLRVYVRLQRGKRIKGFFIIDDHRATSLVLSILRIIKLLFIIIFVYLGLLILFTLFPYTKSLSDELLGYVVVPLKAFARSVIDYMPKLFNIIVIIVIFWYIKKAIRSIADRIGSGKITIKGFYPDWAHPTYNIISVILFIFMFILIYPNLPRSDSQVFQGVSVLAGLMLSLGSTSVIGNLVAGLVITYMRPFRLRDRIKIGEFTGDVVEKTPLVTRIKTTKNEVVTIPNSNVMSAEIVNYTISAREHGLILYTTVGVGYEVPWQKVYEMLEEVAERTENLSKKQKSYILQDRLSESCAEYQLNVYVKDAKLAGRVYSDLRQHIQDVFAENKIELISPQYSIQRNVDDSKTTIPPKYNSQKK